MKTVDRLRRAVRRDQNRNVSSDGNIPSSGVGQMEKRGKEKTVKIFY